jgi:hypothetical protein
MTRRPRGFFEAEWVVLLLVAFVILLVGYSFGRVVGYAAGQASKQKTKVVYLKSDNRTIIETPQVVIYADESLRVMDVPKELPLGAMKGK